MSGATGYTLTCATVRITNISPDGPDLCMVDANGNVSSDPVPLIPPCVVLITGNQTDHNISIARIGVESNGPDIAATMATPIGTTFILLPVSINTDDYTKKITTYKDNTASLYNLFEWYGGDTRRDAFGFNLLISGGYGIPPQTRDDNIEHKKYIELPVSFLHRSSV